MSSPFLCLALYIAGQGSPYTLHELYEWASGADALTGDRREILQRLEGPVKRLSSEACVGLLKVDGRQPGAACM